MESDVFARAMMEYRNTPDQDTGCSPAEIVFGHPIPMNMWLQSPEEMDPFPKSQEMAVTCHQANSKIELSEHTVVLAPLKVNVIVTVQNQAGNNQLKWDLSGVMVEVLPFDKYQVRIDGSRRVTQRNRK